VPGVNIDISCPPAVKTIEPLGITVPGVNMDISCPDTAKVTLVEDVDENGASENAVEPNSIIFSQVSFLF
jgi:hypothetical protein